MAEALPKAKYRIGQLLWYIADGYITSGRVQAIFLDKWNNVNYGFRQTEYKYDDGKGVYPIAEDSVKCAEDVYADKEGLIKYVKTLEADE